MASYTIVEDWKDVEDGYIVSVTVRQTDDEKYPCGWDYALHLGEVGGATLLRYDNAHERTKRHERHTENDVDVVEFPGTLTLYDRFKREADDQTPGSWTWSE
jgi:hypothetical protein